jgi:DNA-binding FadR family transcriptional regulator
MSMLRERNTSNPLSEFLRYLAQHEEANGQQLPALSELSRELGVSIASLREQLEVARALGLVEVRNKAVALYLFSCSSTKSQICFEPE